MPGDGLSERDIRAIEKLAEAANRVADEVGELNGHLADPGSVRGGEGGPDDADLDAIRERLEDLEDKTTRLERDIDIVDSAEVDPW